MVTFYYVIQYIFSLFLKYVTLSIYIQIGLGQINASLNTENF